MIHECLNIYKLKAIRPKETLSHSTAKLLTHFFTKFMNLSFYCCYSENFILSFTFRFVA